MATFNTYKFIAEIKKRPALWDSYCEEYEYRKIKRKYWDEIVEIFRDRELGPVQRKLFEKALKQRWKSIRGCFARELKKQIILKSGGSGGYKTEYVHYKRLMFLKKVISLKVPPIPQYVSHNDQQPEIKTAPTPTYTYEPTYQYLPTCDIIEPKIEPQHGHGMFVLLASTLKKVPEDFLNQIVLLFTVDNTIT